MFWMVAGGQLLTPLAEMDPSSEAAEPTEPQAMQSPPPQRAYSRRWLSCT